MNSDAAELYRELLDVLLHAPESMLLDITAANLGLALAADGWRLVDAYPVDHPLAARARERLDAYARVLRGHGVRFERRESEQHSGRWRPTVITEGRFQGFHDEPIMETIVWVSAHPIPFRERA